MKRKTIMKLMALTVASTLMVGSTMSVFAEEKNGIGFNSDDWGNRGEHEHNTSWEDAWSWENQDSGSTDSGSASVETNNSGSGNGASADTGTSAPAPVESGNNGGSNASGNSGSAPSGSDSTASTPVAPNTTASATAKTIDKTGKAAVPGYETFIQAVSAGSGTYKVTHCGDVKAILQLADADGNAVSGKSIALAPMADGRYAVAFTSNDAAATYTVATTKGDAVYLTRLGIVAVTVDGNVVRDLVAEEAAVQAAAAK